MTARTVAGGAETVSLRRFPYPFRAALAICSDIDGTRTRERLLAIQEFLNTSRDTSMGPGLGLEIGNSFFPYTPDDSLAYFSSRPADRDTLETLIAAGYVDCIHSFGDGVNTRARALEALETFTRRGLRLSVWVDHARAPSNFGKDTSPGAGDVPGSPIYHADATLAYGVRFVWKGRGSSLAGRELPYSVRALTRLFDPRHPVHTVVGMAREAAKIGLARAGSRRFAIHRHNRLIDLARLQDGQAVYEFIRTNSYWRGLSHGHDNVGLAYVLRRKALSDMVAGGGYTILYTHLGAGPAGPPALPPQTQAALRGVAEVVQAGLLYVTTTARLLAYCLNHRYLRWSQDADAEGRVRITVHGVDDPLSGLHLPTAEDLQGITFYVPDRHRARLFLGERELTVVERHPADDTGRESVSIPRTFLTYPL